MKNIMFFAIFLSTMQAVHSQRIYECDASHSWWTFEKGGSRMAVKISAKVQRTENKNVISAGNYVLQYVITEKEKYIKSASDTGLIPLIAYAQSEGGYMSEQFHAHLDLKMLKAPVEGRRILIWSFDMPTGVSPSVKAQIFVNVLIGDKIFGLSSSQFSDQSYDEVKDFLVSVISTLKEVKSVEDFDKLCAK